MSRLWFTQAKYAVLASLLMALMVTPAFAQMPGDGATSKGNQPGAPAGSYTLTDFEHLNLYNGNLNFSLPLVKIGGRGGAKSSVNLTIDGMQWHLDVDAPTRQNVVIPSQGQYQNYMLSPATTATVNCRIEDTSSGHHLSWNFVCDEIPMSQATTLNLSIINEYVGPTGMGETTYNISPYACGRKPGYGPGVVQGQGAKFGRYHPITLTRLTFIASDGTEYELRDTQLGGKPVTHTDNNPVERGHTFVSAGGEGIVFVADDPIFDVVPEVGSNCPALFYPSGYLYFSDGTKYHVNSAGDIEYIRDANGNTISYLYDTTHRVTQITDSLNRQVIITYDNASSNSDETYDDIKYQSAASTWRHVKVFRTSLSHALRSGFSISSISDLFGALTGLSSNPYNPDGMATRVELPDESNRNYKLFYNPYGVLARVEVPTGGAVEYDRAAPDPWGVTANEPLVQRRVYAEGGGLAQSTAPDQKQVYSWEKSPLSNPQRTVNVTVENFARTPSATTGQLTEQLQSKEIHSYYGWPDVQRLSYYGPWREGLEFKSETYAPGATTPLRRIETEWEQPYPVGWVTQTQANQSPETSPNNNPRIKSITTSLLDAGSNLVSKQIFGYDNSPAFRPYNNRTDVWEYAFGNGAASTQLLRHTQTRYLFTDTSPNPTPTPSPSPNPSPTPVECFYCPCIGNCLIEGMSGPSVQEYVNQHLFRLPAEVRVYQGMDDNTEQLQARTEYVYDEEASLWPRSNITGWTDPGSPARGNVTTTKSWVTPTVETAYVKTLARYDVAGNLIETTDANNAVAVSPKVTTINYTDCFGPADGNARTGTSPTSLTGSTYAFPTSVTNLLGLTAYTKYDYYSGSPVTTEDHNGVKSNMFYDDPLGRIKQIVQAVGTAWQRQISFDYQDNIRTIITKSDLNTFGDQKLKSETIYDKLGRTIETHSYESNSSFVTTGQTYDGLGRVIKSTNPYRTTSDSTYDWIETKYDVLGRVTDVKTNSDNALVKTEYAGNTVTVTDQSGKQRKSVADALGKLAVVYEDPSGNNYQTSYTYDALGDLLTVTQGAQTRTFVYDALSRLTSATNPETGTIGYTYDNNNNLQTKTDARGTTTTYNHDLLNRVTQRSYSGGTAVATPTVTYTYDAPGVPNSKGRLTSVSSSVSTYNYTGYDAMGRATASQQVTDGQTYAMSYGYDLAGNMTSQTYPTGRVITNSFDNSNRLSLISGQLIGEGTKTYANSFNYTVDGMVERMRLGNGRWEHTSFNKRLQPIEIALGASSADSSLLKLQYDYGTTQNNGNVLRQIITVPTIGANTGYTATQHYRYDELNRLTGAQEITGESATWQISGQPLWQQCFSYDRFGNRAIDINNTTSTLIGPNPQINLLNNKISPRSGEYYEYDLAGNLKKGQGGDVFGYDGENKLVQYQGGTTQIGGAYYYYDGEGRRVKKARPSETTIFVYNISSQLVAEYTSSTPDNNGTSYLTTDILGTPRILTKADGSVKYRHDYLPFGEEVYAGTGNRTTGQSYNEALTPLDKTRQKFTQKERDVETNLDYFGARYYSSLHGRFTSADPENAGGNISAPQSLNGYAYSLNNPLRYIDPDGLRWAQIFQDGSLFYEWFDDEKKDIKGETEYSRALGAGWSAVSFDESKPYAFTSGVLSPGETLTTTTLNPNGTVGTSQHTVTLGEWLKTIWFIGRMPTDSLHQQLGQKLLRDFISSIVGTDTNFNLPNVPGPATGTASTKDNSSITKSEKRKLGNLLNRASDKIADVIRSRGGTGDNVRQAGHWAERTLAEAAKAATEGDATAETAIKIAKQAGRLGQRH